MTAKVDPLAAALAELNGTGTGGVLKVDAVFGERPQVLEAIEAARKRKPPVSYRAIARLLSADNGGLISEGAVQNWCTTRGLP